MCNQDLIKPYTIKILYNLYTYFKYHKTLFSCSVNIIKSASLSSLLLIGVLYEECSTVCIINDFCIGTYLYTGRCVETEKAAAYTTGCKFRCKLQNQIRN